MTHPRRSRPGVFFHSRVSQIVSNPEGATLPKTLENTMSTATITATCPECDATVTFERAPLNGEIARCTDCSAELEVVSTNPLTLELAPEVEEDWGE